MGRKRKLFKCFSCFLKVQRNLLVWNKVFLVTEAERQTITNHELMIWKNEEMSDKTSKETLYPHRQWPPPFARLLDLEKFLNKYWEGFEGICRTTELSISFPGKIAGWSFTDQVFRICTLATGKYWRPILIPCKILAPLVHPMTVLNLDWIWALTEINELKFTPQ